METNTETFVDRFNTGTSPLLADTDSDDAGDYYEAIASFTSPFDAGDKPVAPYPLPDPDGTPPATHKPVKVFIMSGQSNMVGVGSSKNVGSPSILLPGSLDMVTKEEGQFPNLLDASGNYLPRNDVWFEGTINPTVDKWLSIGCGSRSDTLGPELGFGAVMGWYYDEPVILLKCAQGNRSLGYDFLPPGNASYTIDGTTRAGYGESPESWPEGTTPVPDTKNAGLQYDQSFLDEADMSALSLANGAAGTNAVDVLDNFATKFPNWAAQGFEIAGFVWWQGHKDGGEQFTQVPAGTYAQRYEQNLVSLIDNLRSYYSNRYPGKVSDNAPFVVGSIGFAGGDWLADSNSDVIHTAQMAVGDPAKHGEYAGTVASVDTTGYWRDVTESPGDQGYHYYNNAETYTLVGDAMARAMIELQDDAAPPTPNPLTFAIAPSAVDPTTIGMVATTAGDASGPVQYYFENTTNGDFRDWGTDPRWDNTGLTTGVTYNFRVKARDAKGNEGDWSAELGTAPGSDVTKPSPDPMSFAAPLGVLGENSIAMTATTASDINGVEYEFVCTVGGGPGSGWQPGTQFTATGLTPGTSYTYIVRAKDSLGNTTGDSAPASATTLVPDTTPPTPATMSFASPPTALGTDTIEMTAAPASDPSGVQYSFEETSGSLGGTSSGWQDSPSYTDTGLEPGTEYTYRVRTRDKSPAGAANNWSLESSATTEVPDTDPPTVLSLSPLNGALNVPITANLIITFDEEITTGTGFITLKNITDGTQTAIDVNDGSLVSATGTVLTIDPPSNLVYQKQYAVLIDATAVEDLSQNPYDGILNDTTWVFTTAGVPTGTASLTKSGYWYLGDRNNPNTFVSVYDGKAGFHGEFDGVTPVDVSISSTIVDYRFFKNSSGSAATVTEMAGSDIIKNVSFTTSNNANQSYTKIWETTDPGADYSTTPNFSTGTSIIISGAGTAVLTGSVDISGLSSGTIYFFYGAYRATPSFDAWMRRSTDGPGQGIPLLAFGNNNFAGTNVNTFATSIDFVNDAGYDKIDYTFTSNNDNGRFSGLIVTGVTGGGGGDDYSTWATTNGISGQPFDGDINKDGISNGVAYALGLSPTTSGQQAGVLAGNVITFTKGAEAITNADVIWVIETSETLSGSWTPAVTQPAGDTAPTISYTFTPGPGTPRKFARLKAVQGTP